MMKKFSALLVFVLLCMANTLAYQFRIGGLCYKTFGENNAVEVTYENDPDDRPNYGNLSGALVIPSSVTYGGVTYSVTRIGNSAFKECEGLTSVIIPNTVTRIGDAAFDECYGLASVTIPSSVISIGDWAFYDCDALTSVTIPNSVISIGRYAFSDCDNLTSATIGNSVASIGEEAFSFCSSLTNLYVSSGNTKYDSRNGCKAIIETATNSLVIGCRSSLIPNSVTSIGDGAFCGCYGLVSISIPNSVTSIGNYAFSYCTDLLSITIPSSVTSIGGSAFYNCSGLTSVTIPSSVTSIGGYAFSGCSGLTSVTIPNSVTSIGNYAFASCSGLTSVTIPNSVTSIGAGAFGGCRGLTSMTVANGNTVYDSRNGCNAIIETASNTLIAGCQSSVIPNSVTSIGKSAFSSCGLTNVIIPNSVTSIGDQAFYNCRGLTSVTIPNSVTNIGNSAFEACDNLTSLTIGNAVTSIGTYAFFRCDVLTSVFMDGTIPPTLGAGAFSRNASNRLFYVPQCSIARYRTASSWSLYSSALSSSNVPLAITFNIVGGGQAAIIQQRGQDVSCDCTTIISATPNHGYHFDHWSTGSTRAVDTLQLYGDTEITAFFAPNQYVVNATSVFPSMGTVIVSPERGYLDTVIITSSPSYGYHFTQWGDGNTDNPRRIVITDDISLTAYFDYNQYTVVGVPSDIAMGQVNGSATQNYLTVVVLSATPNYGYHFVQWNDGSTQNPRIVSVDSNKVYTALFDYNQYTVSGTSVDTVMGSVNGTATQNYLTNVTLTAVANYGYHFTQWNDGNTQNPRTIVADSNKTYTASFDYNQYTVAGTSADPVMGVVNGSATQNYQTNVTLTAVANYGYHFTQWNDGNTQNPRTIVADSNKTYTASFDYNQYTVAGNSADTVMGVVNGSATQNYLTNVTLTAVPNYGYHFTQWNDGNTQNPRTIVADRNKTYTASFDYNQYTISGTPSDAVMGQVNGSATQNYLTSVILTAVHNYGYHFTQWNDGDTQNPRTIVADSNKSYTAIFDYNQYTVAGNSADIVMGVVNGTATQNYLTNVTLTAVPNYGYHFTQWNDGSTQNPRAIVADSNKSYTASFDYNQYTIAGNSANTVMGVVNGSATQNYLTNVTLTAVPNYGYYFTQWNDGNTDNPRTVTVDSNKAYTALFDYNQYTVSGTSADTVMGLVNGSATQNYLTNVTLTAVPNYGYHFTQWNDGNTQNPRTIVADSNKSYSASFDYNQYTIAGTSADTVMGQVNGSATQNYLTNVTLTAVPNYGYHFTQWNDGNTDNPRTVTVDSDKVYTALFDYNQYTIAGNSADTVMGAVDGSATQNYLTNVTLAAVPNYGYHFTQWNDGNTQNPRTIVADSNKSYTASFDYNQYTVSGNSADTVMGVVNGSATQNYLTNVTLTAVPNYGYHFTQWNDGSTQNPRSIVADSNKTYTASFDYNQYTVAGTSADAVMGHVNGSATQNYLTNVTLTAVPNYGYHFTQWNDGNTQNPRTIEVASDAVYTANFDYNIYVITGVSADTIRGYVDGTDSIAYLSSLTLSATANYGYHFAQWNDGNTDNPRTIVADSNQSFMAYFDKNLYAVEVAAVDSTRGYVLGGGIKEYLDLDTIEAVSNYGYHFSQWSDGVTENPRVVTVISDTSFLAIFDPNEYVVSLSTNDPQQGMVMGAGRYYYGDTVAINAVAAEHHHLVNWSDGVQDENRSFVITRDTALTANFAIDTVIVQIVSNDIAWGQVTGSGEYAYGEMVNATATAYSGYEFYQWDNGNNHNPYTFAALSDTIITAIFVEEGWESVEDASMEDIHIYTSNMSIYIDGGEGLGLRIYDLSGRLLVNGRNASNMPHRMPAAGVYMVQVGSHPAEKVVVVR